MMAEAKKIVFLGTPELAVPFLSYLVQQGWPVSLVLTQPDQLAGRKLKLTPPPVKIEAEKLGLPVKQIEDFKSERLLEELESLVPDLFIVVAFGRIIPPAILALSKYGAINVHPSLLPKYRGPSPIQTAIIHGDEETGLSIMKLDREMDTGPILAQRKIKIAENETALTLIKKIMSAGPAFLKETIELYLSKKIQPQPQSGRPSVTRLLTKKDGLINWQKPAREIERQIRAFFPWPGAYTYWQNAKFDLIEASVMPDDVRLPPGTIYSKNAKIGVACGQGSLELIKVKPASGKTMSSAEFQRGHPGFVSSSFG